MPGMQVSQGLRQLDDDLGQQGIIVPNGRPGSISALALTATRGFLVRFRPTRDMTIVRIVFGLSTAAGTNDEVDLGIYDAAVNRIVSSGATLGKLNGAIGAQSCTIAATKIKAGVIYYGGFSAGTFGGSAAQVAGFNSGVGNMPDWFGTTPGVREIIFNNPAHPLPSTFVPSGGPISSAPALGLMEF